MCIGDASLYRISFDTRLLLRMHLVTDVCFLCSCGWLVEVSTGTFNTYKYHILPFFEVAEQLAHT